MMRSHQKLLYGAASQSANKILVTAMLPYIFTCHCKSSRAPISFPARTNQDSFSCAPFMLTRMRAIQYGRSGSGQFAPRVSESSAQTCAAACFSHGTLIDHIRAPRNWLSRPSRIRVRTTPCTCCRPRTRVHRDACADSRMRKDSLGLHRDKQDASQHLDYDC